MSAGGGRLMVFVGEKVAVCVTVRVKVPVQVYVGDTVEVKESV
jgi:hypothetical protein